MKYIRFLLSFVLIGCVYTETGFFTALFALLVLASIELIICILKEIRECIKEISARL